jgi:1,4-alpha-glucan branching enzyme
VLSVASEGMPLLYNGQEAGNPKRLQFFEKDPIEWREHPHGELYRKLFALKKANTALWNGEWGARMVQVVNNAPTAVFSFVRMNERDKVFAVFNFSKESRAVQFTDGPFAGNYTDFFSGQPTTIASATRLELGPWDCRIFVTAPR